MHHFGGPEPWVRMRHGGGPEDCDSLGARDVWVYEADGTYYMHYDAAGPTGWLCSLAVSPDGIKNFTILAPPVDERTKPKPITEG